MPKGRKIDLTLRNEKKAKKILLWTLLMVSICQRPYCCCKSKDAHREYNKRHLGT